MSKGRWEEAKKRSAKKLPFIPFEEFEEEIISFSSSPPSYSPSEDESGDSRPRLIDCPYRALLRAVIHRALLDTKDVHCYKEAEKWFFSTDMSDFSFNWCLMYLDALHLKKTILLNVELRLNHMRKQEERWQLTRRLRAQQEREN